jgi:hypothetical protein
MSQTPPGWYPDQNTGGQRYWDGNAWTEQTSPAASAGPAAPAAPAAPQFAPSVPQYGGAPAGTFAHDLYAEGVDPRQVLDETQRQQLSRHGLTSFSTGVAILLHFVTLGIFTVIYQGLKFSKLPRVKPDDFEAGKAIGFLFIPFYNYYWLFRFWLGLTDRINFQFKLRGEAPPVSRGLALTTAILTVIPYVGFLGFLFVMPFLIAQLQGATNRLAAENEGAQAQVGPGYAQQSY